MTSVEGFGLLLTIILLFIHFSLLRIERILNKIEEELRKK